MSVYHRCGHISFNVYVHVRIVDRCSDGHNVLRTVKQRNAAYLIDGKVVVEDLIFGFSYYICEAREICDTLDVVPIVTVAVSA